MTGRDILRFLRAAAGNAVVWGAGWFTMGFAVLTTMRLAGFAPAGISLLDVFGMAIRIGIVGGIAGGGFAAAIRLLYRGRRLSELSWVRFAISGAVVTGLGLPLFLQAMNVLSGDGPVAWSLVTDDAVLGALFGGAAAAGSLRLAQIADRFLPGASDDTPDLLEAADRGTNGD